MVTSFRIVAVSVFSLLLATPSWADNAAESRDLFLRLDSNEDGLLEASEVASDHERLMARLLRTADENGDRALSADEFVAGLTPDRAEKPIEEKLPSRFPGADAAQLLLLKMDTDGDGQIREDEVPVDYLGAFDQMVDRIDRNDDGIMQRQELARGGPQLSRLAQRLMRRFDIDVQAELARVRRDQGEAANRFDARPDPARMLADPKQARQLFAQFDGNGDGQLELAEVPEPIRERFRRLFRTADRDRDERLSEREFLAGAERVARFLQVSNARPSASTPAMSNAAGDDAKQMADPAASQRVGSALVERMVARMDRNDDGQIARAEAQGMLRRRFEAVDDNGDGLLDAGELAAMAEIIADRLPRDRRERRARPGRPSEAE